MSNNKIKTKQKKSYEITKFDLVSLNTVASRTGVVVAAVGLAGSAGFGVAVVTGAEVGAAVGVGVYFGLQGEFVSLSLLSMKELIVCTRCIRRQLHLS